MFERFLPVREPVQMIIMMLTGRKVIGRLVLNLNCDHPVRECLRVNV